MELVENLTTQQANKAYQLYEKGVSITEIQQSLIPNKLVEYRAIARVVYYGRFGTNSYCNKCGEIRYHIAKVRGGMEKCIVCSKNDYLQNNQLS